MVLKNQPQPIEFAKISAGDFIMGIDAVRDAPESPVNEVFLGEYHIGKVTAQAPAGLSHLASHRDTGTVWQCRGI
jgi:hypothetical protein